MGIFDFIAKILGQLLYYIYITIGFHNYGVSLVLFTIIIKLALLPLTLKQLKSTQKMQEIQPEIQKLQQRYKNDKEKLNQEMMKLYQEKKVNPAGGCLPMLFQLPVMFALFYVIRKPLTYMYGWSKQMIGSVLIRIMEIKPELFPAKENPFLGDFEGVKTSAEGVAKLFERNAYHEINIISAINDIPSLVEEGTEMINLAFLKIFNLGVKPTYDFNLIAEKPGLYIPALVLVLVAAATTFISSKMSMAKTAQSGSGNAQMNQTGKTMMYFGPLMTLLFGFQLPLGLSLYWTVSNAVQIAQQYYTDKYMLKKKEG
jgi:YidC/Oxa1 family membrane protein insertase